MVQKKTLVFGASLNPERYSNMVYTAYLLKEIEVVAFGLKGEQFLGYILIQIYSPY